MEIITQIYEDSGVLQGYIEDQELDLEDIEELKYQLYLFLGYDVQFIERLYKNKKKI